MLTYYFEYNNIVISDFLGFGVVDVDCPTIPEREISSKTIQGRNGSIFQSARDKDREITVKINVLTDNQADYLQTVNDLKGCFRSKDESKLFLEAEDLYINAVVKSYNFGDKYISENNCYGEGEITFYCADPYFYKTESKFYDNNSDEILDNEGDVEAYPLISVEFEEDATFLQIDSPNGSILLGEYPNATLKNEKVETCLINEPCESLSNWNSTGNVVDEGSTGDTLVIGGNGSLFEPNITSSQDTGWHGACYRRNLPSDIKDFKIEGYFLFYSDYADTGAGNTGSGSSSYKITANPALRIRAGRGTGYKILGTIPYGKTVSVNDISNGWGKVTYNGVTGYCYMTYMKQLTTTSYNYRTTANLNMRSGRGTGYKILVTIPNGTSLNITNISGNWGYATYRGQTGYVYMSYVTQISKAARSVTIIGKDDDNATSENTTSDMLGLLEMYGFDSQNNKLFKCQLLDNNYYYRDTKPSVFIGNTCVLTDSNKCPAPKTKKDEDGNITKIDSGDSGSDWNHFYGSFFISRKDDIWTVRLHKRTYSNVVTKTIEKTNLSDSKYPIGNLAYIVIYMAGYGTYKIQHMAMNCLYAYNLTPELPEEYNPIIINQGDIIDIDCKENLVYKNGTKFMDKIDIGSNFFSLDPGENTVSVYSSAKVSAAISFTERFN